MSAVPGSLSFKMSHEVPSIGDNEDNSVNRLNLTLADMSIEVQEAPSTVVETVPAVHSFTANNDIPVFETGKMREIHPLGFGAQGVCMKVFVKNLGICVRKTQSSNDAANLKNERREMVHSAMLNHHPNIVSFFGVVAFDRRCPPIGILMEYMPGGSLSKYLFERPLKVIDRQLKIDWCRQIALGLAYMHSRGIMHRDLNPNNILLSDLRLPITVKICDFGLSREIDGGSMTLQTGTGAFMAPEVILNGNRTYDSSADVFSYGMTVYSIFAQMLPFANEGVENWNLFTHRTRLLGGTEYPDRPLIPESAGDMESIIKECWDSNASVRPSMEQVNQSLENKFGQQI